MCRRALVSGTVQGVGYRAFARRAALELGIRGHARNLPDGRVEVLACGEAAALEEFVGLSFQYADYQMRYGQAESGPPTIVSTVKINQAGFTEMMDTEAMFRKWFAEAKASKLLP